MSFHPLKSMLQSGWEHSTRLIRVCSPESTRSRSDTKLINSRSTFHSKCLTRSSGLSPSVNYTQMPLLWKQWHQSPSQRKRPCVRCPEHPSPMQISLSHLTGRKLRLKESTVPRVMCLSPKPVPFPCSRPKATKKSWLSVRPCLCWVPAEERTTTLSPLSSW